MPELPSGTTIITALPSFEEYFTADGVPPGLLKEDSVLNGMWGVIRVRKGSLECTVRGDGDDSTETYSLSPKKPGVILPNQKHTVKSLSNDVEFRIEFHVT